jgi:hypothetical protein
MTAEKQEKEEGASFLVTKSYPRNERTVRLDIETWEPLPDGFFEDFMRLLSTYTKK